MDLTITPRRDLAMIAVQGPNAGQGVAGAPPRFARRAGLKPFFACAIGDTFVARTGYTGEDGFEIMLPAGDAVATWNSLAAAGWSLRPGRPRYLAPEARHESLRPGHGREMSPLDAGLAWTVVLDGKSRLRRQGGLDHQRLPRRLPRPGTARQGGPAATRGSPTDYGTGEITSGSFSPTLQMSIALARLPLGLPSTPSSMSKYVTNA